MIAARPTARSCSRSARPARSTPATGSFPAARSSRASRPREALARELHEELGIDIERARIPGSRASTPIRTAPCGCTSSASFEWKGEPHPREDQAIAWQRVGAPMVAPMLPANAPVLASLALPVEYAITDAGRYGIERHARRARAPAAAGAEAGADARAGLDAAQTGSASREQAIGARASLRLQGADEVAAFPAPTAFTSPRPS